LIAGAVLALTPVATLMFRYNNPDALLTLLLVAAAYATVRALEVASTRWLIVAGTAIGFAFLAKMLQGFLIIPAFAGVYLLAAPTPLLRRVRQVAAAAAAVVVSAGWWVALVLLWPAAARPYIGGSQTNNIIELILGYNGLGRLTGNEVGRVGGGVAGGGAGPFSDGAGWLRLFQGELASQVSWLLPAALVSLAALLWVRRATPRTDPIRAQALLWGGWLLITGLVFSLMQGIFHSYYAVVLVPPIGGLLGLAVAEGWKHWNLTATRVAMGAGLVASAAWTAVLAGRSPDWNGWLVPAVLPAALTVAAVVVWAPRLGHAVRVGVATAGVVVLLAASAVGSLATAAEVHTGAIPVAEPIVQQASLLGGRGGLLPQGAPFGQPGAGGPGQFQAPRSPGGGQLGGRGRRGIGGLLDAGGADPALVAALQLDATRYRWVAATTGSMNAAGLALSSGEPVMAIGGFNGSDPAPTLAEFQAEVAAGQVHYYVATRDRAGFRGTNGGSNAAAQISAWVADHFAATTVGGLTVYDLSPG
jgi:4-amino-4-deoxy-L-arabinose transferase-like glycosyltransferase